MNLALIKVFIAAAVISFCAWLSGKKPEIAGFIVALPITTLLALAFSQAEWGDSANTIRFAKSILVGIPFSLLFFVPFVFADKFHLSFWGCYIAGLLLLVAGYFLHRVVMNNF